MQMTRDEIESMKAGKELDVLVAEKYLGWVWVELARTKKLMLITPEFAMLDSEGKKYTLTDRRPKSIKSSVGPLPFSEYIEYAWMVVTHDAAHWEVARTTNGFQATCLLLNEKTKQYSTGRMYAETAPLAICRAALFVVS